MNLAHRGASSYAPENTLSAFYKAIELGANGIETDLRCTKDGIIVLMHDKTVDRTTDGSGNICDFTWNELMNLDAGLWFDKRYIGERVVKFADLLHFFGRKELMFALELKSAGLESETIRLISEYNIKDKVTITSFNFEYLKNVRHIDSEINIGYLVSKIDDEYIEQLESISAKQICPSIKWLEEDDIKLAREHKLQIRTWGIKDVELMEKAIKLGVDGMTINFPDKLAKRL